MASCLLVIMIREAGFCRKIIWSELSWVRISLKDGYYTVFVIALGRNVAGDLEPMVCLSMAWEDKRSIHL